jgi:hypothetical protein
VVLLAVSCALLLAAGGAAGATPPGDRHVVSFAPGRGPEVEAQLASLGVNIVTRGPGFIEVEARSSGARAAGAGGAKEAAFVSTEVRMRARRGAQQQPLV